MTTPTTAKLQQYESGEIDNKEASSSFLSVRKRKKKRRYGDDDDDDDDETDEHLVESNTNNNNNNESTQHQDVTKKRAAAATTTAKNTVTFAEKNGTVVFEGNGNVDENDDPKEDARNDDDDEVLLLSSPSDRTIGKYVHMNSYGEHKRAVSSIQIAPPRICKNRLAGWSNNSNDSISSSSNSPSVSALIASASADGTCKVWDFQHVCEHYYNEQQISKLITSTTLSSKSPKKQSSEHRKSLTPITTCTGHSRGINEVCWNPASPLLATASDDKTIRLWDAVTGDSLVELRGHDNFVFAVDQKGDTNLLVSGSFDETVKLWDIRTAQCVSTIPAHSDPVTGVSLNRDGTTVASSSHDGLIRIWDVATGECLKTMYAAGNPPVSSIKYSPNGKFLLAGTLDSTIRLWPITVSGTNKCAKTYSDLNQPPIVTNTDTSSTTTRRRYHVNTKYSIVSDFTCTGDVVTGSETGDVVIYSLQDRTIQQVLKGHNDVVLAVSAHDTLPIIASGAMTVDKKVEFWFQPPQSSQDEN